MKVIDIIRGEKPSLSFEIFPPKTDSAAQSVGAAADEICKLHPSFMSVTYGAGGNTDAYTADTAARVLQNGVTPLAHLTCISSTKETVHRQLESLKARGIENILALRGDRPVTGEVVQRQYRFASDLAREIRAFGGFCIGGACYPEGHPESENSTRDIDALKLKCEAGCEFLTTQMFFDNNILYNFMFRAMKRGVEVPIVAGIMPVTSAAQIKRILDISGTALPQRFLRIVDRYADKPEAMKQAGIAFATEQIVDLFANGINAVHVYSMNKPDVAAAIQSNLSEILR